MVMLVLVLVLVMPMPTPPKQGSSVGLRILILFEDGGHARARIGRCRCMFPRALLPPRLPRLPQGLSRGGWVLFVRVLARRCSRGRTGGWGAGAVGGGVRGGDAEKYGERVGEHCDERAGHGADYGRCGEVAVYCLFFLLLFVNLPMPSEGRRKRP